MADAFFKSYRVLVVIHGQSVCRGSSLARSLSSKKFRFPSPLLGTSILIFFTGMRAGRMIKVGSANESMSEILLYVCD